MSRSKAGSQWALGPLTASTGHHRCSKCSARGPLLQLGYPASASYQMQRPWRRIVRARNDGTADRGPSGVPTRTRAQRTHTTDLTVCRPHHPSVACLGAKRKWCPERTARSRDQPQRGPDLAPLSRTPLRRAMRAVPPRVSGHSPSGGRITGNGGARPSNTYLGSLHNTHA